MKEFVTQKLDELNIPYEFEEHEAVFTVAESLDHLNGRMSVKNLLLKEEKGERLLFVVMKGDERLDTKALAAQMGAKKLQFAKPEVLKEVLGVEPGSASLFCLFLPSSKEVEVVVDSRLLKSEKLGFHPMNNTQTMYISAPDIQSIVDHTKHKTVVLERS